MFSGKPEAGIAALSSHLQEERIHVQSQCTLANKASNS